MSGSDMMNSSSVFFKLSGELHSLTALEKLLNSMGPIDVKKLYLRVLILLLRAIRFGTKHWGPVLSLYWNCILMSFSAVPVQILHMLIIM